MILRPATCFHGGFFYLKAQLAGALHILNFSPWRSGRGRPTVPRQTSARRLSCFPVTFLRSTWRKANLRCNSTVQSTRCFNVLYLDRDQMM